MAHSISCRYLRVVLLKEAGVPGFHFGFKYTRKRLYKMEMFTKEENIIQVSQKPARK